MENGKLTGILFPPDIPGVGIAGKALNDMVGMALPENDLCISALSLDSLAKRLQG